jgi:hypothetical protein
VAAGNTLNCTELNLHMSLQQSLTHCWHSWPFAALACLPLLAQWWDRGQPCPLPLPGDQRLACTCRNSLKVRIIKDVLRKLTRLCLQQERVPRAVALSVTHV